MHIRGMILVFGFLLPSPAVAQAPTDELARMHMVRMQLIASQISALARVKIDLEKIFRDHNALSEKATHDVSLQAAASCSHEINFELGGAWLNLETTQDLLSLNGDMQTAADQQMVSLSLRNHVLETQNAVQLLAIAATSGLRSCPADQQEFSAIQSWTAQSEPVLDRIKETADAMSK